MQLSDPGLIKDRCYLGGEWVAADSGETIPVTDPATGEVLAHVPRMGASETGRAIDAARAAWPGWRERAPQRSGRPSSGAGAISCSGTRTTSAR